MQVIDENNEVWAAFCGTKEELLRKAEMMQQAESFKDNIRAINIAELPQVGEEFEIKGLRFRCSNVSKKKGYVGLHLIGA